MSIAHCIALSSWFSKSKGALNIAIIASPIYLSTIPLCFCTADCCAVKALFIMYVTFSGSTLSLNEVNPLTSVNKNVAYFLSPPSFNNSGLSCKRFTCRGSK